MTLNFFQHYKLKSIFLVYYFLILLKIVFLIMHSIKANSTKIGNCFVIKGIIMYHLKPIFF